MKRIYLVSLAVESDLPPNEVTTDNRPSIGDMEQALAAALGYKKHQAANGQFIIDADTITVIATREE